MQDTNGISAPVISTLCAHLICGGELCKPELEQQRLMLQQPAAQLSRPA
jgi:hypothetical protein